MIQINIVSYKYGHLLAHCIESVLEQTLKADKILIIDDGVGDCVKVVEKYGLELLQRNKNMGIVDNFNDILLNHTDTQRTMFIGADNYLRPDALELLAREDADIVSSDITLFGTETSLFKDGLLTEYKDGYNIWRFKQGDISKGNFIHGSSLYNVDMAKKCGYKNSGGRHTEEDWKLWQQMIQIGAKHKHVPEPLLFYRRHKNNFNKI